MPPPREQLPALGVLLPPGLQRADLLFPVAFSVSLLGQSWPFLRIHELVPEIHTLTNHALWAGLPLETVWKLPLAQI